MADISHHNCRKDADGNYIPFTRQDLERAATILDSIMLKATEGTSFISPVFEAHAETATAIGIPWGAYHYVDAGHGKAQADHFVETVAAVSGQPWFYCIDWEGGGRLTTLALAESLLATVDKPVGDYIGSWARANGGQLPSMAFHIVPEYGPAQLDPKYATDPLSAWQYTNGVVNGTDMPSNIPGIGPCDVSVIYRPEDFGL